MISTPFFIVAIGIGVVILSVLAVKFDFVSDVKNHASNRLALWLFASVAVVMGSWAFLSNKIF